ncbi:hypothetical protein ACFXO9_18290 [Nocardia tengchongensis]|uniref:hypothetical protein n=1 Tax=Nocardia tengchongensis TaxID=2055889 RepID=UPI003683855C
MRAWVLAVAAVAAVGAVAGCNDDTVPGGAAGPVSATTSSAAAGGGTTGTPVTTLPDRDAANVDARDFQQQETYYFQSPTGNIMCAFTPAHTLGMGCQLEHASVIPAALPGCGTRPDRAVAVQIVEGTAKFLCTSQGIYVGAPLNGGSKGGGKVLEYGQTLIVRGTACTSTTAGVRCDSGGHGFLIAADQQQLF